MPFFSAHLTELAWSDIQPVEWLSCAYVVGVGTFVCYLLLNAGQSRLAPPVVAAYNYVQPVIAAAAGILWGVDALTWQKVVAVLLIIGGVWLVRSRN
jgi:drug/metabolite transporter (DMT)-like permease